MYEDNSCDILLEQDVCRTCLFSGTQLMNAFDVVFDKEHLVNILKHHLFIEIKQDDKFPKVLCKNCIHEVRRIQTFHDKCKHSETKLQMSYNNWQSILNYDVNFASDNNLPSEQNYEFKRVEVKKPIANCESKDIHRSEDKSMSAFHHKTEAESVTFRIENEVKSEDLNNFENELHSIFDIKTEVDETELIDDGMDVSPFENFETLSDIEEINSKDDFPISGRNSEIMEMGSKVPFTEYRRLMDFSKGNHSEDMLLAYFVHLSKSLKAVTLRAKYRILWRTLDIKENVDISKYFRLSAFLKRQCNGCLRKKSRTLNTKQMQKFILEAPDETFLLTKVALIFGVAGACRREELAYMEVKEIEDLGYKLLIKIPGNKMRDPRSFTVNFYLDIYRKYVQSRPTNCACSRFFVKCFHGKRCKIVGLNQFSKMPKMIASFLNLTNPLEYTGHCFHLSSATILFDYDEYLKSTSPSLDDDVQQ